MENLIIELNSNFQKEINKAVKQPKKILEKKQIELENWKEQLKKERSKRNYLKYVLKKEQKDILVQSRYESLLEGSLKNIENYIIIRDSIKKEIKNISGLSREITIEFLYRKKYTIEELLRKNNIAGTILRDQLRELNKSQMNKFSSLGNKGSIEKIKNIVSSNINWVESGREPERYPIRYNLVYEGLMILNF